MKPLISEIDRTIPTDYLKRKFFQKLRENIRQLIVHRIYPNFFEKLSKLQINIIQHRFSRENDSLDCQSSFY